MPGWARRSIAEIGGVAIAVFGLLAFAYLTVPAVDPDYGWHVANGRHLLDGVLLAGVDIYSWTARGATWIAHEWLTEGVMAFVRDSVGPTGNSLLAGGLPAAALVLTVLRVRGRGFGVTTALVVGVIALLDAGTLVSVGPAAVEVAAVAFLLWLVDRWRSGVIGNRGMAAATLVLMLAWANTHGSFVLGLGILAATGLGLAWERDPRARIFAALAVAAALVTLVNPFGLRLWTYVATAISGPRLNLITEWAPPNLPSPMWWAFVAALGLAAVGLALATRGIAGRRPPSVAGLRLDDAIIALALAIEGLAHARHAGVFGIGAAPAIGAGIATGLTVLGRFGPRIGRGSPTSIPRLNAALLVVVGVLSLVLVGARVGPSNTAAAVRAEYPVDALPALDALACGRPGTLHLLNDYAWGGWLEMTRPAIPVFIDGRSEVFGDAQVARYAAILGLEPGWEATLDATGAQVVLLRSGSKLAEALPARGWTVVHRDDVAALLVRNATVDMSGAGLGGSPSCP